MIHIQANPFGDTRTCNVDEIQREQFDAANYSHLADISMGLTFFITKLWERERAHDWDKTTEPEATAFFNDFKARFAEGHTSWWDNHRRIHRHHLAQRDGIPEDINLIDVLEYITDCVMAGLARSGTVTEIVLSDSDLRNAFNNTIELLKSQVVVRDNV